MPTITILIAPLRLQYDQMIAPTHMLSQPDNDRADTPAIYKRDNDRTNMPTIYRPADRRALHLTTITTRRSHRTAT